MPPQFRRPFDSADDEDDDEDEDMDDDEDYASREDKSDGRRPNGRMNGVEDANQINDELKYGAGHRSLDSNPVESQSEWSDDECREEATGENSLLKRY